MLLLIRILWMDLLIGAAFGCAIVENVRLGHNLMAGLWFIFWMIQVYLKGRK